MQSDFSPWQIARLRRGLRAYRVLKARNGHPPTWERVAAELEKTHTQSEPDPRTGLVFQGETLRRFAAGEQALKGDKPFDLCRFLIASGALLKEEMEGDDALVADALAAHRVLARTENHHNARMPPLGTVWQGEIPGHARRELLTLTFLALPMDRLALVEERSAVYARERPDENTSTMGAERRIAEIVRRGYTLFSSDPPRMHIMVRGHQADDLVHYVNLESIPFGPWLRAGGFVRSRADQEAGMQTSWRGGTVLILTSSQTATGHLPGKVAAPL